LNVNIPAENAASASYSATASLSSVTPLPNLSAPAYTSDGKGGGTGTIAVPNDPRIVETMVYIYDTGSTSGQTPRYYSVGPLNGTGSLTFTLPDNLGVCIGSGCQSNSSTATPTIQPGDQAVVYAVTYDYPMFEASPPSNTSQTPAIAGSSGQADISLSPLSTVNE
jgi:hypothetical protein